MSQNGEEILPERKSRHIDEHEDDPEYTEGRDGRQEEVEEDHGAGAGQKDH